MSLEKEIETLTNAVNSLSEHLISLTDVFAKNSKAEQFKALVLEKVETNSISESIEKIEKNHSVAKSKSKKEAKKSPVAEESEGNPSPKEDLIVDSDKSEGFPPLDEVVSREMVREKLIELSQTADRATALAILQKYGATKVPNLDPKHYNNVYDEALVACVSGKSK